MLNIGTGELLLIVVVALLVLGPTRLPQFARGIGKFLREFRRQTDEVRVAVEREFYRMDADVDAGTENKLLAKPGPLLSPAPAAAEPSSAPPADVDGPVPVEPHAWARPAATAPAAEPADPAVNELPATGKVGNG